jgi:hypothetical protein
MGINPNREALEPLMSENETPQPLDWNSVTEDVRQFAIIDSQLSTLSRRKKELRDRLFALTMVEGEEDDREHVWFTFPEPIQGLKALQVQRRVSHALDEDVAKEVLSSVVLPDGTSLWDGCIEMVPTLDEDKIYAALTKGLITPEQVDDMFPKRVTEAFLPVKVR